MRTIKAIWAKFLSLRRWQQIVLVIILISLISSETADNSPETTSKPTEQSQVESTPAPTESPTPTPTVSESASPSPTPDSPLEFRFSVLRDLEDMRTGVERARTALNEEGGGQLNWNILKIVFNFTQLEMRVPAATYENEWEKRLARLDAAVSDLSDNSDSLTISTARSKLNNIIKIIPSLEAFAKTIGN